MKSQYQIKSLAGLDDAAKWLLETYNDKKQFAFYGAMGVGKTTFIKAICKRLGAVDVVNSPTFAIVNEYQTEKGQWLYHLDLYRIEDPSEAYDFGIEEYLGSNNYCFMEWPEKIESILDETIQKIYVTELEDGTRHIEVA
ncbi:MAG: tRNA (adenosine(37)-N6)-threonylcarbamoyltransferase complex ATPase subunit type 1 TsaE [Bacteroidales bacterium]|nr:tRNA (adenosine(37)-N6)-threonylcarbamoyltransferase complex ATPase subunit type 1 TsaE [Bacteroidales bacterium]